MCIVVWLRKTTQSRKMLAVLMWKQRTAGLSEWLHHLVDGPKPGILPSFIRSQSQSTSTAWHNANTCFSSGVPFLLHIQPDNETRITSMRWTQPPSLEELCTSQTSCVFHSYTPTGILAQFFLWPKKSWRSRSTHRKKEKLWTNLW